MSSRFSSLIRKAQSGDRQARSDLVRLYQPRVMTKVRGRLSEELRREFDSTDIAQSVFIDVLRDLPRFEDRGEDAFFNWLRIKAENKVNDKLRGRLLPDAGVRERRLPEDHDAVQQGPGPGSTAERAEEAEVARRMVASLGQLDRRVVDLRLGQGRSFGEIAGELGLPSADAARKRFTRSIVELRRLSGER